jgi:hypothetical protein
MAIGGREIIEARGGPDYPAQTTSSSFAHAFQSSQLF